MAGFGWRLARNRGSAAQLPLALCVVAAVIIALLGKTDSSVFDTARTKLTDWAAPVLAELHGPIQTVQTWIGGVGSVFTVYRENLQLRRENIELRRWHDTALALQQRLDRYELLLNAVPDPQIPSITARVIGQSSRPFVKTMILDAGKDEGVREGQAVLDARGLMGRVYLTGAHTAWVIRLTDLNSRVPVEIAPSNRRAILAGDNSVTPLLQLDLGAAPIKAGDRVVTTGDGGALPAGLPVGEIVPDGKAFRVALYAEADRSDYVRVLNYRAPEPPLEEGDRVPGTAPATKNPQAKTGHEAMLTPRARRRAGLPSVRTVAAAATLERGAR